MSWQRFTLLLDEHRASAYCAGRSHIFEGGNQFVAHNAVGAVWLMLNADVKRHHWLACYVLNDRL
jgi:hypothetical protein